MRRCGHKIPRVSILSIPSSCNTSSCVTPTPLPSPQHFISSSTMSVPYQDRSSKTQTCCNNTDVPHLHKTGESLNAQKQYINLEEKGKKNTKREFMLPLECREHIHYAQIVAWSSPLWFLLLPSFTKRKKKQNLTFSLATLHSSHVNMVVNHWKITIRIAANIIPYHHPHTEQPMHTGTNK
jgi:hypothetical protein